MSNSDCNYKLRWLRWSLLTGLFILTALLTGACGDDAPGSPPSKAWTPEGGEITPVAPEHPLSGVDPRPLNVIVVSFDALRADALDQYGGDRDAAPNMSQFAAESVVFRNAYTASPITPTSFSAFLSGELPTDVFIQWKFEPTTPLVSRFQAAGYQTVGFINNVQLTPERGFDQGYDHYNWSLNQADEKILDQVLSWLGTRKAAETPFFLWVHFLRPHAPYIHRPETRHLYREEFEGSYPKSSGVTFETSDPREAERLRDLYLGEVWMADKTFARLLEEIRTFGLLESSIVVLTSDHGEEFMEHGKFQHVQLYEESLRIPMVIHHPHLSARRIDRRIRSIDLLPSLLELVGLEVPEGIDGVSLLESWSSEDLPVVGSITTGHLSVSVLDRNLKLVLDCHPEISVEMYDLEHDPSESTNLLSENVADSRVRDLARILYDELGGSPCRVAETAKRGWHRQSSLDQESLDALRSLGYLK